MAPGPGERGARATQGSAEPRARCERTPSLPVRCPLRVVRKAVGYPGHGGQKLPGRSLRHCPWLWDKLPRGACASRMSPCPQQVAYLRTGPASSWSPVTGTYLHAGGQRDPRPGPPPRGWGSCSQRREPSHLLHLEAEPSSGKTVAGCVSPPSHVGLPHGRVYEKCGDAAATPDPEPEPAFPRVPWAISSLQHSFLGHRASWDSPYVSPNTAFCM